MTSSAVHDVHCHFVPSATREFLAAAPSVRLTDRGIVRGSAVLPLPARLSDRDAFDAHRAKLAGVVVAPPPALYLEDVAAEDRDYVLEVNRPLADVARDQDGLAALAWLPLSSPEAAVAEVERIATDATVVGVVVGTSLGAAVADPSLAAVWSALAEAQLGVFLHPDSDPFDPCCKPLPNPSTVGFPTATTAVALALLTRAESFWHAGVNVCLPHGGGFLATALGRVLRADPDMAALVRERLNAVWVDSVVFGDGLLELTVATFGSDRTLSGSDWPFPLSMTADDLIAQRADALRVAGSPAAWCPRLAQLTTGESQ
jgi:aminocarboxymuconate-semialdehyde decarboxylase